MNKEKEKNFISAVVYVHNAQSRIGGFLKMLLRVLNDHFEHSEIICVNDCSDDFSVEEIRKVCEYSGSSVVTVVNMSYFHGLELAMCAGQDLSIGDFVFEFDSTDQDFDESVIMDVYRRSLEGYDIVSATPDRKEKLSSRLFYRMFDHFTNLSYQMSTERFRILSRRVINRLNSMHRTVLYRKAMYASCGLKTDNLRYTQTQNAGTVADKKERKYRTRLAADSLILFTELGYRFSIIMTLVMMVIALAVIVYTVITYFTANPVAGWTTTILFLSIGFFALFAILTIIVKYLQLLVDRVFKRRQYTFESIEKIKL